MLRLARMAGLAAKWNGQGRKPHMVAPELLREVLAALDLPAATDTQCRDSLDELAYRMRTRRLVTAEQGQPAQLPMPAGRWRITLETGEELGGKGALPATLPLGYHQVESPRWVGTLAVAPPRCWTLADAGGGRPIAGLATQLYALWRRGAEGCGDFAALAELAVRAAQRGLQALAISPVHALSSADPGRCAPYAPSSRVALNPVYAASGPDQAPADGLIDWRTVATARLAELRRDFQRDAGTLEFARFRSQAGPELRHHALFEAIAKIQGGADWRRWPARLATPLSPAVYRVAHQHADEVEFQLYLQYRADAGLAAAQQAARESGMRIGLIADLAAGVDPGGSDAWMQPRHMLRGLSIGAPPDAFNQQGQGWGLVTFSPWGLYEDGFSAWIRMVRAALAHAGGVRIDHAMALTRLWVIPDGASPQDGVYLSYPREDMMRLLALESQRHKAVILAEDLGTVPAGFSAQLAAAGMAGLRVLWFERKLPPDWARQAAAMTSTHDLPTVAGWWRGRDLDWRRKLGLAAEPEAERQQARRSLWRRLRAAGVATGAMPPPADGAKVARAAASFIGRTSSLLALLPLEDALGVEEQPNLPGTVSGHPNWRRLLPEPVETLLDQPEVAAGLQALRMTRAAE